MKYGRRSIIAVIIFLVGQSQVRALSLTENPYLKAPQSLSNLFFKKIEIKMGEAKDNFIVEHAGDRILFYSRKNSCSTHPITTSTTREEVLRVEVIQKKYKESTYEEVLYYPCRATNFLFKEVLITRGKDLKLMSRDQVLNFQRNVQLGKNETQREFSVVTSNGQESVLFQVLAHKKKNAVTYDLRMSGKSAFGVEYHILKSKVEVQSFSVFYPVSISYNGGVWSTDRRSTSLSIEQRKAKNPWFFVKQKRGSRFVFNETYKNHFVDGIDGTLGKVASLLIKSFPRTKSLEPATTTGRFQVEFLNNLLRVQSGDFTTTREFFDRMDAALRDGRLEVDDKGF